MDEPGIRESRGWNRRDALKALAALGAGSMVAVDAARTPSSDAARHDSIDAVVRSGRYLRRNEILVPRS
jgi:hypothetical protein